MHEFEVIARYFKRSCARQDVLLGIGDDCALLEVPSGQVLAVSIDTSTLGVHFPDSTPAYAVGYKSLAVSLSDLAAMGAKPAWVTLALSLPEVNEAWLSDFSAGFFALAEHYSVSLVGGDTTRGPLSISTQVHGFVPKGQAITRRGAQPGDGIFVSGCLGDAGLGLKVALGQVKVSDNDRTYLLDKLNQPRPRVALGMALRTIASAALDLSDGLAGDLRHILNASQVGAKISLADLPLSTVLKRYEPAPWRLALNAGDDYELCFTAPAEHWPLIKRLAKTYALPLTKIGLITSEPSFNIILPDGTLTALNSAGFQHF